MRTENRLDLSERFFFLVISVVFVLAVCFCTMPNCNWWWIIVVKMLLNQINIGSIWSNDKLTDAHWKQTETFRTKFYIFVSHTVEIDKFERSRWKWKCPSIWTVTIVTLKLTISIIIRKAFGAAENFCGIHFASNRAPRTSETELWFAITQLNTLLSVRVSSVQTQTYDQEWIISYQLRICQLLLTTMRMAIRPHSNSYNSWCWSTAVRMKLVFSKDYRASPNFDTNWQNT